VQGTWLIFANVILLWWTKLAALPEILQVDLRGPFRGGEKGRKGGERKGRDGIMGEKHPPIVLSQINVCIGPCHVCLI